MSKLFDLLRGFIIILGFYYISLFIIKFLNIHLSAQILGLILFSIALYVGFIKEAWIKTASELLINNIALFLVPFIGGLIVYKNILIKNWLMIFVVIFTTTTLVIVLTGLFVEYGLKFLRLHRIRKKKND